MMRAAVLVVLASILFVLPLAGCASGQQQGSAQKYDYADVKRRVRDIPVGATTIQVMVALGSPHEQRGAIWIYRPGRTGLLVPSEYLQVNFRSGRYMSHEVKPVILGEQLP
ncbi:MAG: hypothetical protein ACYTJ0_18540 [Planctomycetota bacterium]|jgi:outer membrane lipoprotein-sorting protein